MSLPKELTTVTTFSKLLALFMFVVFSMSFFFAGMAYQKINSEISSISITPVPTPFVQNSDKSNWKRYTNTEYGYQIMYPPDKFVNCNKNGFVLFEGLDDQKNCASGERPTQFSIDAPPDSSSIYHKKSQSENCYDVVKENIVLAGTPAIKFSNSIKNDKGECDNQTVKYAKGWSFIFVNHNNSEYEILINEQTNPDVKQQILSTFKFLDSTPSPKPTDGLIGCTLDAKLCPDGSSVGRTGPNCEFAACPN